VIFSRTTATLFQFYKKKANKEVFDTKNPTSRKAL